MQRFAAVLVLLLAGLSLLVSTEAYQVARPVNPAQVPIVTTEQGALRVEAGANNSTLYNMVSNSGGRLLLDMTKGPGGPTYGFAANSTYTLNKIIRVTNTTGSAKNVSLTVSGNTVASLSSVTGHIGAGNPPAQPAPFALPPNQYVEINLAWTTAGTAGANPGMTITVTGN